MGICAIQILHSVSQPQIYVPLIYDLDCDIPETTPTVGREVCAIQTLNGVSQPQIHAIFIDDLNRDLSETGYPYFHYIPRLCHAGGEELRTSLKIGLETCLLVGAACNRQIPWRCIYLSLIHI